MFRDEREAGTLLSLLITGEDVGVSDEKATAVRAVGGGTSFTVFSRPCAKRG